MNIKFYERARAVLRVYYGLLFPSKVTGAENIPDEGGCIICANHIHWRDPLYLAVRLPKRRYTYLGKAELFEKPLYNRILGDKGLGGIPINRGHSDLNAVRLALKTVADGEALGIFPQGTRSKDNTPTPMLSGVAMIAIRAKAPIIPIYIDGPYRLFHHVDVHVGAPVDISEFGRRADKETLEAITAKIAAAIWAMAGSAR